MDWPWRRIQVAGAAALVILPVGVLVLDPEDRISLMNRNAAAHFWIQGPGGWLGRPVAEILELFSPNSYELEEVRRELRAAAEDQRRERASAQAVAVRRLAVLLVLPTGLCLLPAFLLLGVVPLVIDLLTTT